MIYTYEKTAYNFNIHDGLLGIKIRQGSGTSGFSSHNFPVGNKFENNRYKTACKDAYITYLQCLKKN